MSTRVRFALTEARSVAESLVRLLGPACHRIEIAGSIRRGRADVGDIELVAVPRFTEDADGFFGTTRRNLLTEAVDDLIRRGVLASHPDDPKRGERYSKLLHNCGLQLDLFSASTESFGLLFIIRTGPADYSRRFVTDIRRRGLHAAEGQLHRGGLGCGEYECEVIPTPEEADVYAAAGWPFVAPGMRA
jgi:DNA polymerase/3'-5' exonuclease PolX